MARSNLGWPLRAMGITRRMARNDRHVAADPASSFAVVADPTTYPRWLIGARRMRAVDDGWPSPGARFHHTVGFWPVLIDDTSAVLEIEPGRRLQLHVRATPLVRAVVTIEVRAEGSGTRLSIEEEPAYPLIGNLLRPVLDPITHLRNGRSLQALARLIEESRGTA